MNHIAGPGEFAEYFEVSRETVQRLAVFAQLLTTWQKTINLVAASTIGDFWHRHFADSAQLLALAPQQTRTWLDLGSGAGFPGLVIGCMLAERTDQRLILIESDSRKCAFLREVVRQTGLNAVVSVDIIASRIETVANTARVGEVDVISARALAPLRTLLGRCAPFFGSQTVALLLKGKGVDDEVTEARTMWSFESDLVPSCTLGEGRIAVIRGLKRM